MNRHCYERQPAKTLVNRRVRGTIRLHWGTLAALSAAALGSSDVAGLGLSAAVATPPKLSLESNPLVHTAPLLGAVDTATNNTSAEHEQHNALPSTVGNVTSQIPKKEDSQSFVKGPEKTGSSQISDVNFTDAKGSQPTQLSPLQSIKNTGSAGSEVKVFMPAKPVIHQEPINFSPNSLIGAASNHIDCKSESDASNVLLSAVKAVSSEFNPDLQGEALPLDRAVHPPSNPGPVTTDPIPSSGSLSATTSGLQTASVSKSGSSDSNQDDTVKKVASAGTSDSNKDDSLKKMASPETSDSNKDDTVKKVASAETSDSHQDGTVKKVASSETSDSKQEDTVKKVASAETSDSNQDDTVKKGASAETSDSNKDDTVKKIASSETSDSKQDDTVNKVVSSEPSDSGESDTVKKVGSAETSKSDKVNSTDKAASTKKNEKLINLYVILSDVGRLLHFWETYGSDSLRKHLVDSGFMSHPSSKKFVDSLDEVRRLAVRCMFAELTNRKEDVVVDPLVLSDWDHDARRRRQDDSGGIQRSGIFGYFLRVILNWIYGTDVIQEAIDAAKQKARVAERLRTMGLTPKDVSKEQLEKLLIEARTIQKPFKGYLFDPANPDNANIDPFAASGKIAEQKSPLEDIIKK